MCEKAHEIQEEKMKKGVNPDDFFSKIEISGNIYKDTPNKTKYGTWLPRQDQLQDMLFGELIDKIRIFNEMFISPPIIKFKEITEEQIKEFRDAWLKMKETREPILLYSEQSDEINIDVVYNENNYFSSMEQMWLALAMKENYNKVWDNNNKEWKVITYEK